MDNPHSDLPWLFYKDLEDLYRNKENFGIDKWLIGYLKLGKACSDWHVVLLRSIPDF